MFNRIDNSQKKFILKVSTLSILILVVIIAIVIKIKANSNAENSENAQEVVVSLEATEQQNEAQTEAPTVKKKTYPYPTMSSSYVDITSATVKSPYIALLDVEKNQIIAGRECNQRIYPASMTKVMTLIVAVENLKSLDDTFTMTSEILYPLVKADATRAGFDPGEVVSANNLLYGLILPSGADAAVALADMISGSEEEYVNLMNQKCEELGLKNTHFVNTSGLHDDNHYTTPIEMAMILNYAMKNATCAKILSTYQYTTTPSVQHPEGILLTSTMFSKMYGDEAEGVVITAGKTGFTSEAMCCLTSYAMKDGNHYIAVTAGAGNMWNVIFDDFDLYKNYAVTNASTDK